jgi:flagellar biogenesis protein FliO
MMLFPLLLLLSAPASAPASPQAISPTPITKETRPDLFADEPPPITGAKTVTESAPKESALSFWVSNLIRTVVVLGLVIVLAYLILNKGLGRLMKMSGAVTSGKHITLIERMALDQKHMLYLVELSGKRFLIGTSEQSTHLISALDASEGKPAMTGET